MRIRFANWQPDLQGLTNPGQQDIKNVIPTGGGGYAPFPGLKEVSAGALGSKALGAIAVTDDTGVAKVFAGTGTKLYNLAAQVFMDVSIVANYALGASDRWEFAQFGQRIIATEIVDPVQYFDIGSSSLFANLAGSPPKARHIAVIRDFVMLGNTANSPAELYWCEFNNSDGWVKGTAQCDAQTLQGGGWVHKVTGGESGVAFQERAVTRITYVGPPVIFQLDLIQNAPGLVTPGAHVQIGSEHFYLSQDGFYSLSDAGFEPIGNNKVDGWFTDHLQPGTEYLITASADPKSKLVMWAFVSTDATNTTTPDTILIYHRISKEFSYAKVNVEMLCPGLSVGVTLEQLSAIYSNLDVTVPDSLDSKQWAGGSSYLAAFDTSHQLCGFNGDTLAALMETSDQEPVPGKRSMITNVRPLCDAANAMVIVRSRERFADTVSDTNSTSLQSNGDAPLLSSGRWHRAQLSIAAGETWSYATGLDIDAVDDGEL